MNDEFLLRFRRMPRPEFADALYKRISQKPQPRFIIPLLQKLTFRNATAMVAFMLLVAACASYIFYERPYRLVGGIWLTVQNEKTRTFFTEPALDGVYTGPMEFECPHTVEEAREILRFEFLVPTRAPEGFTFTDTVCGVRLTSEFINLSWKGSDESLSIALMIRNLKWRDHIINVDRIIQAALWGGVVTGSYKEVQVNGQPAVLIRGDWSQPEIVAELSDGRLEWESKWDKNLAIQLAWVDGEILYHLRTSSDVSVEDLIKMAESAR